MNRTLLNYLIQVLSFILFSIGLILYSQNSSQYIAKGFLIAGVFLSSVYLTFFQKDREDFMIKLIAGLISSSCLIIVYSIKFGLGLYIILLSILQIYFYKKTKKENLVH